MEEEPKTPLQEAHRKQQQQERREERRQSQGSYNGVERRNSGPQGAQASKQE